MVALALLLLLIHEDRAKSESESPKFEHKINNNHGKAKNPVH